MRNVPLWKPARWRTSAVFGTITAIAVVWVLAIALYHYPRHRDREVRRVESDMLLRTNVRTIAIEQWLGDLRGAAGTISSFPSIRPLLLQPPVGDPRHMVGILEGFIETEELLAAAVLDAGGRPVVAAGDTAFLGPVFAAATRASQPLTDIVAAGDGRAAAFGATPMTLAGRRTGTAIAVADPGRWLYPFLEIVGDIPSYDIFLVRTEGTTRVNVSPMRTGPRPPFAERVEARPDLPSVGARAGDADVGRSRDYRGVPVIAARRRVAGTVLTLVAKVDEASALGEFRRRAFLGYLVWTLLLALVLGILARVAQRQRRAYELALAGSTAQRQQVEQLLGSLATASPAAIVAVDLEGMVTFWNPAAERILGWTPPEVLGRPIPYVPEERRQESSDNLSRAFLGEAATREVTRVRKDGSRVELLVSTAPMRDQAGRVVGSVAVMSDITERRKAEDALRQAEERLRSLTEHAPDIIYRYRLRPDPGFEYVSPSAAVITGYTPEEHYADPDLGRRMVHPDDRHLLDGAVDAADEPIVLRRVRKDGRVIWTEQRNTVIRDAAGAAVAIEGIARDVTEAHEAAAERALLSTALDQAAEGIVITDPEGVILHVNPAFERLTGYTRAEVVGQNPRVLRSGRQARAVYANLWAQLKRGEVWKGEFINRRKDGSLYTAEVLISPVLDHAGRIVNYVGFQRDVTRERELDDHLRHVQRIEAVGQLSGGIAHDFNNLLAVILMNAGALRQDLHLEDPGVRRTLADLEAAARRGAELVRKLMAFSRRDTIVREPRDLGLLLAEVERTLRRLLPETIAITLERPDAVVPVLIDAGAFEQIALNLATNARDAMPDGGRLGLTLDVQRLDPRTAGERTLPEGAYAVVTVADTGHGMDPRTLERAIEPFFTTKAVGAGTGLGLSMVHGLMHQHDGFVTLTSEKGGGTTVRLCFPLHQGAEPSAPRPESPADTIPRGTETVLLVEDEPDVRRGATRLLERLGYKVATAANGREALEAIAATSGVAVVISDAVMPEMSGPELLRHLRESGNRVPFVLASGYAAGGQTAALALDPSVITVDKPFTVETIARAVRAALDGDGRR